MLTITLLILIVINLAISLLLLASLDCVQSNILTINEDMRKHYLKESEK